MNISSIIIKASPENWEEKLQKINALPSTNTELEDKTKGIIIATIEAQNAQEEIQILKQINLIDGISSADMHLTYSENELKDCKMKAEEIAELIDEKPLEEMKYSGDVNNFLK